MVEIVQAVSHHAPAPRTERLRLVDAVVDQVPRHDDHEDVLDVVYVDLDEPNSTIRFSREQRDGGSVQPVDVQFE